jgi:predicted RNase H-like HicB family nuclease
LHAGKSRLPGDTLLFAFKEQIFYLYTMHEIIFIVEASEEGGFTARALTHSIFTQGETLDDLKEQIKDAVHCHFEDNVQRVIRLHLVHQEVFAA